MRAEVSAKDYVGDVATARVDSHAQCSRDQLGWHALVHGVAEAPPRTEVQHVSQEQPPLALGM
jgi:hypothetical protein